MTHVTDQKHRETRSVSGKVIDAEPMWSDYASYKFQPDHIMVEWSRGHSTGGTWALTSLTITGPRITKTKGLSASLRGRHRPIWGFGAEVEKEPQWVQDFIAQHLNGA